MRRFASLLLGLTAAAVVGGCESVNDPGGVNAAVDGATARAGIDLGGTATYEVTITNLTSGQPLTPPLAAVHRRPISLFTVGEAASFGLKEIAENGNLGPMVQRLENELHVRDLVVAVAGDPPPLMPGASISFNLESESGAKYLSFAAMLICTNDGFTGIDGMRLPNEVGETVVVTSDAYDAGTEMNTEDFADLVPPCPVLTGVPSMDPGTGTSNPALAEGGVIHHHPGIQGNVDLVSSVHAWSNPVAEISIERVQ